jgi:hypothetical protein
MERLGLAMYVELETCPDPATPEQVTMEGAVSARAIRF